KAARVLDRERLDVRAWQVQRLDRPRFSARPREFACNIALVDSTDRIPHHPVSTTARTFADLGLSPEILDAIREVGFEHPTPIQAEVIPKALTDRDIIALAQTGSGKTAAFVIPIAQRLTHGRGLRVLIVSPTREIALQ